MAIVPRKKLIYTDEYPYHVMARSNNREWFYVSKEDAWNIFVSEVNRTISRQGTLIHSFVLMDNHYHMLISATEENDLGTVMRELQGRVSRRINRTSKRINHVFGGPYKASLIETEAHYATIYKYVYRNPVKAKLCSKVEDYPYSTIHLSDELPTASLVSGIYKYIPEKKEHLLSWLNTDDQEPEAITRGLRKTVYEPVYKRKY